MGPSVISEGSELQYSHQDFAAEEATISEDKAFLDNFVVAVFRRCEKQIQNGAPG